MSVSITSINSGTPQTEVHRNNAYDGSNTYRAAIGIAAAHSLPNTPTAQEREDSQFSRENPISTRTQFNIMLRQNLISSFEQAKAKSQRIENKLRERMQKLTQEGSSFCGCCFSEAPRPLPERVFSLLKSYGEQKKTKDTKRKEDVSFLRDLIKSYHDPELKKLICLAKETIEFMHLTRGFIADRDGDLRQEEAARSL